MRVEGIRAAGHGAHGTRQKIPDKGRRTGEYSCTYYMRAPLELRDLSNDFWVASQGCWARFPKTGTGEGRPEGG